MEILQELCQPHSSLEHFSVVDGRLHLDQQIPSLASPTSATSPSPDSGQLNDEAKPKPLLQLDQIPVKEITGKTAPPCLLADQMISACTAGTSL